MRQFLLPRLRDILFFALFSAAILLGPQMLNQDGDLPRHLTMGRFILQQAAIPTKDIFSYTVAGQPFAPHEWLADVIFYSLYHAFGLNGLVIFTASVLATLFTLIYNFGVSRTGLRIPVLILVGWGAAVSSLHWIVRPHILTMLFLAIWLILSDKLRTGESIHIWIFPILMTIWANTHGEFIAGFLVLIAYLAGWAWDFLFTHSSADFQIVKRLIIVLIFSFFSSLINPVGFRIWTTILGYVNNNYLVSHTNETNPPDFLQPKFLVLLAFIVFSIILLVLNRKKLNAGQVFLLAGFTVMSLTSARNVHLYGIVAPFVLASTISGLHNFPPVNGLENFLERIETQLKGVLWPLMTIICFSALVTFTPLGKVNRFDPGFFPVQAVTWLKQNPREGHMFNAFDWGGYLLFNLWPTSKVFIDSQTDVYGANFTRQYEQIVLMENGWQEILKTYQVSWIIIPPNWPLASFLHKQPSWQIIYQDGTSTIFEKK